MYVRRSTTLVRDTSPPDYSYRGTPAEQAAVHAWTLRSGPPGLRPSEQARPARDNLELRREAYRTALDAESARAAAPPGLRSRPGEARPGLGSDVAAARRAVAEAQPAARAAQRAHRRGPAGTRERAPELLTFVFRLLFVLARHRVRLLAPRPLAADGDPATTPSGSRSSRTRSSSPFVMAADYLTDYFDPLDLGPLVLSLFGIVADAARLRGAPALSRARASLTGAFARASARSAAIPCAGTSTARAAAGR